MDNYDPYSAAELAPKTHNRSPFDLLVDAIEDAMLEARNWADGDPISNQDQADSVTKLHDDLHELGKQADALRIAEKAPLDEQIKAIQDKFNGLIGNTKTTGKGKVVLGKEVLAGLLTPWRNAVAAEKEAAAKKAREEADAIRKAAEEAIRSSAGNIEAREEAEALVRDSKALDRDAKRADKAATTGTGLRTIWHADLEDETAALDWGYMRAPEAFRALVQSMAEEVVRGGMRSVPGFKVYDERIAN